jgi:hypothetical protein
MELYTPEELSGTCERCGQKRASLFKTRAEMERWIAWANEPEKPEVVPEDHRAARRGGKIGASSPGIVKQRSYRRPSNC